LQTSRGCAEFGRRERETVRPAPTCFNAGYFKRITAGRDSLILFNNKHIKVFLKRIRIAARLTALAIHKGFNPYIQNRQQLLAAACFTY